MPRVLIVDDEPSIRRLIGSALRSAHYDALEAADGPAALEAARRARPHLILLDVALPGIDGFEVCRRLHDDPATAGTPVLLLSGFLSESDRERGLEAGAAGWIAKPFTPSSLLERVRDALTRRAPSLP